MKKTYLFTSIITCSESGIKYVEELISEGMEFKNGEGIIEASTEEIVVIDTTKLFIHLQIQDGERRHDHKVLVLTKCKNIEYAVQYYIAHFWGFGKHNGDWWEYGECSARLVTYEVLTDTEYTILNNFI